MSSRPLTKALLAGAAPEIARELGDDETLEATLAALVAQARAAWPDVRPLADDALLAQVGRALREGESRAALASFQAADLYLAVACASGDPSALRHLDRMLTQEATAAASRVRPVAADDLAQTMRERLLIGTTEAPPKILQYAGRGPLSGWLRVVAARVAITILRSASSDPSARGDVDPLLEATGDPELDVLRDRYAVEFKAAFEGAVASLDVDDRNVLRLSLLDRLTIDEIGALYRVHRATAARWLERAREKISTETRRRLRESLRLTDEEFESLLGLLLSRVDVSLQRLLSKEPE